MGLSLTHFSIVCCAVFLPISFLSVLFSGSDAESDLEEELGPELGPEPELEIVSNLDVDDSPPEVICLSDDDAEEDVAKASVTIFTDNCSELEQKFVKNEGNTTVVDLDSGSDSDADIQILSPEPVKATIAKKVSPIDIDLSEMDSSQPDLEAEFDDEPDISQLGISGENLEPRSPATESAIDQPEAPIKESEVSKSIAAISDIPEPNQAPAQCESKKPEKSQSVEPKPLVKPKSPPVKPKSSFKHVTKKKKSRDEQEKQQITPQQPKQKEKQPLAPQHQENQKIPPQQSKQQPIVSQQQENQQSKQQQPKVLQQSKVSQQQPKVSQQQEKQQITPQQSKQQPVVSQQQEKQQITPQPSNQQPIVSQQQEKQQITPQPSKQQPKVSQQQEKQQITPHQSKQQPPLVISPPPILPQRKDDMQKQLPSQQPPLPPPLQNQHQPPLANQHQPPLANQHQPPMPNQNQLKLLNQQPPQLQPTSHQPNLLQQTLQRTLPNQQRQQPPLSFFRQQIVRHPPPPLPAQQRHQQQLARRHSQDAVSNEPIFSFQKASMNTSSMATYTLKQHGIFEIPLKEAKLQLCVLVKVQCHSC